MYKSVAIWLATTIQKKHQWNNYNSKTTAWQYKSSNLNFLVFLPLYVKVTKLMNHNLCSYSIIQAPYPSGQKATYSTMLWNNSNLFMTQNRLIFLPQPPGLSRAGSASGYNCMESSKKGIRSTNTQGISTMFGCDGKCICLLQNLKKSIKCTIHWIGMLLA